MKKILIIFSFFLLVFILTPTVIQSAGIVPCGGATVPACGFCDLLKVAQNVVKFLLIPVPSLNGNFAIVPIMAVLLFALAGFFMLTSAGSPGNLGRGKQIIVATVVGLLIIYGAWLFLNTLLAFISVAIWGGPGGWWSISC